MSKTKNQNVAVYVQRADALAAKHSKYVETYITRGNGELYVLLGEIMEVCIDVLASKEMESILSKMRSELRNQHNARPQKNSHPIAIVCRYIYPSSRKSAHVYMRVIEKALAANVAPADLPNFIKKAGGIDAVRKSVANAEAKKLAAEQSKAERKAIAEVVAKREGLGTVHINSGRFEAIGAKDVQFGYAICERGANGEVRVVGTVYPNKAIEEQILNFYKLTCAAAAMDDGTSNFKKFCDDWGFNMDLVHRWMRDNGIASYKEARAMVGISPNAKIKQKK